MTIRKKGMRGPSGADPADDDDDLTESPAAGVFPGKSQQGRGAKRGYLDGQMLIAMPAMGDERFARSVIYVCAHSTEGAMGIIVNRPAERVDFPQLLVQLKVIGPDEAIRLPAEASSLLVLSGGPVDTSRGFVLHSNDFSIDNST